MIRSQFWIGLIAFVGGLVSAPPTFAQITDVDGLLAAVENGAPGDTIRLGAGTFELPRSLQLKPGMTLRGSGIGRTIIRNASSWSRTIDGTRFDNDIDHRTVDRAAYLIDLGDQAGNVSISHLTLSAPSLHGGIYGNASENLSIRETEFRDFQWSGVRTFRLRGGTIENNHFVNAGGQVNGDSGGTGGSMFMTFTRDTTIRHNRIRKTADKIGNVFGVKGRKATNVLIANNTIETNFAIELPFENDANVVIRNNHLGGVVSVPKFAGGPPADVGESFRIHHNYFNTSYAIEGARNGLEIDHNFFDFDTADDRGNLISQFGREASDGPTHFHNNLVLNPGRGIFWSGAPTDNLSFYNNHIIGETTITPRGEGLFGIPGGTDFSTVSIRDNIITLAGLERPLLRISDGYDDAVIENNLLEGISDIGSFSNPMTGAVRGPTAPLRFNVGADNEFRVDGFSITPVPEPTSTFCLLAILSAVGTRRRSASPIRRQLLHR